MTELCWIVKCELLDCAATLTVGLPWLSEDLAQKYCAYVSRLGRGKRRYWIEPRLIERGVALRPPLAERQLQIPTASDLFEQPTF
jgi:hypothetical protein